MMEYVRPAWLRTGSVVRPQSRSERWVGTPRNTISPTVYLEFEASVMNPLASGAV